MPERIDTDEILEQEIRTLGDTATLQESDVFDVVLQSSAVIDLYSGVGGLTHGFVLEGFTVTAGIDLDETCKYAYEKNNPGATFHQRDVDELTADEVKGLYPAARIKIMIGCAPCQPFSPYTNAKSDDEKWRLVISFAKLISEVKPDVVSMENVPQLRNHEVYQDFLRILKEAGYEVSEGVVECVRYDIPQTRKRLVLLASLLGPISLMPPTHTKTTCRTVQDVIGHLEPLKAGQASTTDTLHRCSDLTSINLERIKASKPGGSWRDWPKHLLLECHKKTSGKSYGSVYGRMSAGEPAPTMTTQFNGIGNGRFGHPQQDRAISFREAAIFQTFPQNYDFVDPNSPLNYSALARHIGNAVPVDLGRVIACSIKDHLNAHKEKFLE